MNMLSVAIEVAGGIGLFLLGMSLMTDGLKSMAGESVRKALMRFTKSPGSGVLTGIITTIFTQSSSATVIITVGFVGAGVLAYSQALGVILGASVGTTMTGWIVAIVGFKLQLGAIASIFIFIGAFMRMFGGVRRSGLAFSLAGFGLIFVGIATLQSGMAALQSSVNLGFFPADDLLGKFVLMAVGTLFTLITQSSTAGVISTLAALHAGVVDFEQAAALVVGMNVGTTFTSAIATIGGNVHVRRTGFSHVVFNTIVSNFALFLITPYIYWWQRLFPAMPLGEIALVGFHTLFNVVGVLLLLPFIKQYARFIERLFPLRPHESESLLDPSVLKYPDLALNEVKQVLQTQLQVLLQQLTYVLGEGTRAVSLVDTEKALTEVRRYLDQLHLDASAGRDFERLLACIHLLDHIQRLYDRCTHENVYLVLHQGNDLATAKILLWELVQQLARGETYNAEHAEMLVQKLGEQDKYLREMTMQQIARGSLELNRGVNIMESGRWMYRVGFHLVRIDANLQRLSLKQDPAMAPIETDGANVSASV